MKTRKSFLVKNFGTATQAQDRVTAAFDAVPSDRHVEKRKSRP
jgi:hypothetical protein